ncbi:hypothetical protein B0A49_10569 [Cryomyces minteri]|nr:hypothetical protein B0A49_10569 [Cryomyces minteri]
MLSLFKRQSYWNYDGGYYDSWVCSPLPKSQSLKIHAINIPSQQWWSPAGMAIKYAIITALLLFIILYFVGGYTHAQRRIKKGLPPLRYHRWMLSRHQRGPYSASGQDDRAYHAYAVPPQGQAQGGWVYMGDRQGYGVGGEQGQTWAQPPPAYNHDLPPTYQPPMGSSKINPDQGFSTVPLTAGESSHARPAVAAPAPAQTHNTGSSNPFRR